MTKLGDGLLRETEITSKTLNDARSGTRKIEALFFRFSANTGPLMMVPDGDRTVADLVGDLIKGGIAPDNIWPVTIHVGCVTGVTATVQVPS